MTGDTARTPSSKIAAQPARNEGTRMHQVESFHVSLAVIISYGRSRGRARGQRPRWEYACPAVPVSRARARSAAISYFAAHLQDMGCVTGCRTWHAKQKTPLARAPLAIQGENNRPWCSLVDMSHACRASMDGVDLLGHSSTGLQGLHTELAQHGQGARGTLGGMGALQADIDGHSLQGSSHCLQGSSRNSRCLQRSSRIVQGRSRSSRSLQGSSRSVGSGNGSGITRTRPVTGPDTTAAARRSGFSVPTPPCVPLTARV